MPRFKRPASKRPKTLRSIIAVKKTCYFCSEGIPYVDYKNVRLLRKFVSRYMKLEPARRTGTCARHQRAVTDAVKRARHLALLPFTLR